jgi:hypothetical protein
MTTNKKGKKKMPSMMGALKGGMPPGFPDMPFDK